MIFFILVSSLISYQQVKNEGFNKCISESSSSEYCKEVVAYVDSAKSKAQKPPYVFQD